MSISSISEMISQTCHSYPPDRNRKKTQNAPVRMDPGQTETEKTEATVFGRTEANPEPEETKRTEDSMEQAERQIEALRRAFRIAKKKTGYNAAADMILLASACTISQVQLIRSRVLQQYIRLKGSGGANESRSSLAAVRRVIQKSGVKIKRLKVENALKSKKKLAQRQREQKREERLDRELATRRRKRKLKEANDILEELGRPKTDRQEDTAVEESLPVPAAIPESLTPAEELSISEAAAAGISFAAPEGGGSGVSIDLFL